MPENKDKLQGIGDRIAEEVRKTKGEFKGLKVEASAVDSRLIIDIKVSGELDLPGNFESFLAKMINDAFAK